MSSQTPAYSTETPPKKKLTTAERARAVAAAKGGAAAKAEPDGATPAKLPGRAVSTVNQVVALADDRLPGITVELELVTPMLAEHYLAMRPTAQADIKQRAASGQLVDRYVGDMVAEQWPFTGDPLRFNSLGEFIDGQHRAEAIVRSGVPQFMIVVRGLDPDAFVVIDTGRPRSFLDMLRSKGVSNVAMVGGVTRRVFQWARGNYGSSNVSWIPNNRFLGVSASPGLLMETFTQMRPEITAASRRANSFKQHGFAAKTAAPGLAGFAYLLLSRLDPYRCENFFQELQIGPAQPGPEYPIFVLRERLSKRVPDHVAALPDWVWTHFFFTTWNRWLKAESMGSLKTPSDNTFKYLATPIDPHAADRPEGWKPLGGVFG